MSGPDVEPLPARRDVRPDDPDLARRCSRSRTRRPGSRATMSVGRRMGLPEASRAAQSAIRSRSTSELTDVVAGRGQEGEGHPPAHHQGVDPVEQGLEHARACRPPWPRRPRPRTAGPGCPSSPPSASISRWRRKPGGAGQPAGRPDHRGVAAVGDAEGVVDVGVVPVDQLLDEGGSLAVSPGSKRRFSMSSTWGASRASSSRTGPRSQRASGAPSGRPRWVQAVTLAPCSMQVLRAWAGRPGCGSRR